MRGNQTHVQDILQRGEVEGHILISQVEARWTAALLLARHEAQLLCSSLKVARLPCNRSVCQALGTKLDWNAVCRIHSPATPKLRGACRRVTLDCALWVGCTAPEANLDRGSPNMLDHMDRSMCLCQVQCLILWTAAVPCRPGLLVRAEILRYILLL